MEIKEYPEKSWSTSRMNILKECPRSYYYNYYLGHNGWFRDAEPIRKTVYKLKKLTNIYMVKGSALHEQVKIAIEEIKDGKEVAYKTENDMRNAVVNKLKEAVVESMSNLSSGKFNNTCKGMMLQEYYYGGSISKENGDKIKEDIKVCIDNLFICKTFDRLSSLTTVKIIEIDETGFDNCLFIDGVKLYFKVDLIYEEENGEVWVVDWKTGKYSEDDKEQLLMYAYYVTNKYGIDINKIHGRIEYLLSGETYEINYEKGDLIYATNKIKEDIEIINSYLEDVNINKPVEVDRFIEKIDKKECMNCKFKELCIKKI